MISGSGNAHTRSDANLSTEQLQDLIKQLLEHETSREKLSSFLRYLRHGIPPNISSQDRNTIIDNIENTRTVLHHLGKVAVDVLWGTLLLGLPFMYAGQGFWMFINILGIDSGVNLDHYDDKNNFNATKGALIGCAIYSTAFQTLRAITASPRCTWISDSMTRKEAIHAWIAVVFGVAFFTGMFSGVDTTTQAVYLAGVASTLLINELLCFFGFAYDTGEWPWQSTKRHQVIDGVRYDNWSVPYEAPRIVYASSFPEQQGLYSQPAYTGNISHQEAISQPDQSQLEQQHGSEHSTPVTTQPQQGIILEQQLESHHSTPSITEPQQTPASDFRTPGDEMRSNISSTTSRRASSKAPSGLQRFLQRNGWSNTPPPNSNSHSNKSTLESIQDSTLDFLAKYSPTRSASHFFNERRQSLPSNLRRRYQAANHNANTVGIMERVELGQAGLVQNPMANTSQSAPNSPTQRYVTLDQLDQLSPSDRSQLARSMRLWLQSNPDQHDDNQAEEKVDQQSTNQAPSVVLRFASSIYPT